MAIIPVLRARAMREMVAFYTQVLDFTCVGVWPNDSDPSFGVLMRDGFELHLSSHSGDGVFGTAVAVIVADVDALFAAFCARGLDGSAKPQSPVHQGPVDQTWGTREFYADDPSGNTVRFIQR